MLGAERIPALEDHLEGPGSPALGSRSLQGPRAGAWWWWPRRGADWLCTGAALARRPGLEPSLRSL